MSSKGFRPPTSFQSQIKCSDSGYPCLSILSGKPSDTSYVLFCHFPEPPLLLPTTDLWLQRAETSLSLTGIWATATAPHRKQVLLALHTLLPQWWTWHSHFSHVASVSEFPSCQTRHGDITETRVSVQISSPSKAATCPGPPLRIACPPLHTFFLSVKPTHTYRLRRNPKYAKMPSSACLFLQGKPPQNQRVGHPEVLRVSPIQQFFQAQNSLFFILVWSSNVLVSSVSHIILFYSQHALHYCSVTLLFSGLVCFPGPAALWSHPAC